MARTFYSVWILFATLADAVRTSITQSNAASEEAAFKGHVGDFFNSNKSGLDQLVDFPTLHLGPVVGLHSILPAKPITYPLEPLMSSIDAGSSKGNVSQSIWRWLDFLWPWNTQPDRMDLYLSEVDSMKKAMTRGLEAFQSLNDDPMVQHAHLDSMKEGLGHALVAYDSLMSDPMVQHAREMTLLRDAFKRSLEAYEALKQAPCKTVECDLIVEEMRQHVKAQKLLGVARAYNKAVVAVNGKLAEAQRVCGPMRELNDKLKMLQGRKGEYEKTLKAYKPVMRDCAALLDDIREWHSPELYVNTLGKTLMRFKPDDQVRLLKDFTLQDLDRLLELEKKLATLNSDRNDLAFQALKRAVEAYDTWRLGVIRARRSGEEALSRLALLTAYPRIRWDPFWRHIQRSTTKH